MMVPRPDKINIEAKYHQPPNDAERNRSAVLRVAAYARVSTMSENQGESYATQCAYYQKLIEANPGMILVDVYGDRGVSGLSTDRRPEFIRMIEDCKAGKIDLVITRSVSRLSRNMAECLETVNALKALGIPVRFEKEGLTSTDPGSEMFFHVLAALAQEESGSASRRITWALARRAELGIPARKCPYGYRKAADSDIWVIDEDDARRVRMAYTMASSLCAYDEILHQLNLMEASAGTGFVWSQDRLHHMLRSEVYRGDVLTHKSYVVDYVDKKRARNHGERPQYYVIAHHEPMVPIAIYERVQSLMDAGLLHSGADRARECHAQKVLQWRKEEEVRLTGRAAGKKRKQTNIIRVSCPGNHTHRAGGAI